MLLIDSHSHNYSAKTCALKYYVYAYACNPTHKHAFIILTVGLSCLVIQNFQQTFLSLLTTSKWLVKIK